MLGSKRFSWPLVALAVGLPVWWARGLAELIYFVMAVPMIGYLLLRRPLMVPSWFGVWLAFLAVAVVSGTLMTAHAPKSLDLTLGTGVLTYGYRLALYLVATVFMLYIVNVTERQVSTSILAEVMAVLFIVTVLGGILGVLKPGFQFTSPMEALLPPGLRSNEFVKIIVHPSASDVSTILGFEQPRPKAPYAYANSWGANFTVTLPFFLWRYWGANASWRRKAVAIPVLVMGAVGVTYSLNRGLWFGIGFAVAIYAFFQVRRRGVRVLLPIVLAAVVGLGAFAVSPLGAQIGERFAHQHSNERRGDLAKVTIESVMTGSPVLGYGNTRRLDGSFFSIAGGATDNCPFCAVPPLGTQGHVWLVLFTQGLLGVVLFFGFMIGLLLLHVRRRDTAAIACLAALFPLVMEMLVYDTIGSPQILGMMAMGLLTRSAPTARVVPFERLFVPLRLGWVRVLAGALGGLIIGIAIVPFQPRLYAATADILIPVNPSYLSTSFDRPKSVTVDTEAQTALADDVVDAVRDQVGRKDLTFSVSALPASRVLLVTVTSPDPDVSLKAADIYAADVVEDQSERLSSLRTKLLDSTDEAIETITAQRLQATPGARGAYGDLLSLRRADRDRVERTLLVDARQIRTAHLGRQGRINPLVAPMSGLMLGLVLGCVAAAIRRPAYGAELADVLGDAMVVSSTDRLGARALPGLIEQRYGPQSRVCVVTVGVGPFDLPWVRRTFRQVGMTQRISYPKGSPDTDTQVARTLGFEAVALVVGSRAERAKLRSLLERLASVGRQPDVIMVGESRLVTGLQGLRSTT